MCYLKSPFVIAVFTYSRNKQHVGKDAAENAVLLLICLDLLQILFSGIFMKENYFDIFFIVYQGSEVTSDS